MPCWLVSRSLSINESNDFNSLVSAANVNYFNSFNY